jgi:chromosome segregation and condensation protein ScpB
MPGFPMNSQNYAVNFFRTMKGAAHTALSVLAYNGRPMTNAELQHWTGYHADTITRVIRGLMQMGWVSARSPSGPWALRGGRLVPGMRGPQAASGKFGTPSEYSGPASENSAPASGFSGFPREFDSGLVKEELKDQPPPPGHPDISETRQALREAGIEDPALSRLARLPHMNPDYVRAHVAQARAEGRGIGAAIWRMERHWRVKPKPQAAEAARTRSEEVAEKIRRFIEGPS